MKHATEIRAVKQTDFTKDNVTLSVMLLEDGSQALLVHLRPVGERFDVAPEIKAAALGCVESFLSLEDVLQAKQRGAH